MRKIIDKYGLINVIISLICCVVFILNCLLITKAVGASGGIFGVIGIAFVMFMRKQLRFKKSEIVWLIIFVLISSVLGMETLLLHAFGFVLGVISGFILIRKNDAK